jgi:hypothetical protein
VRVLPFGRLIGGIVFSRLLSHLRHNVVGYIALFFALTGVAYAAGPLKSGDPAGGDLTGTYPNPSIAQNAVDSGKVSNDSLTGADVDESSLGKVPDSDKLDGLDSTAFGPGAFTARVDDQETISQGATRYVGSSGFTGPGVALDPGTLAQVSPNSTIVARDLAVRASLESAGVGNTHATFTLLDDGTPTSVSCTITDPNDRCNSGTATANIAPGSRLVLRIEVTGVGGGDATDIGFGWRATTP